MATTKKTTAAPKTADRKIKVPAGVIELQKRVLSGQRAAVDTAFNAATAIQDSQDKAFHGLLGRASFVPEQAREMAETWAETRRGVRDSYKASIDKSFVLVEQWIDGLSGSRA